MGFWWLNLEEWAIVIGYFFAKRKILLGISNWIFLLLLLEKRGIHIVLRENKFFKVFYQCCLVYFKPRGLFYSKENFFLAFCFLVWNMWYPIFGKSGKIIFKVECIQNECFFCDGFPLRGRECSPVFSQFFTRRGTVKLYNEGIFCCVSFWACGRILGIFWVFWKFVSKFFPLT